MPSGDTMEALSSKIVALATRDSVIPIHQWFTQCKHAIGINDGFMVDEEYGRFSFGVQIEKIDLSPLPPRSLSRARCCAPPRLRVGVLRVGCGSMAAADNGGGSGGGSGSLETRPGVLLVGSPNVGKRTLLSRLLSIEFPDTSDLSTGVLCQGWTIDTKYYTADLSIWTAHLDEEFSFRSLPISKQLDALVMVFDMNDESSFVALQDWVAKTDIKKFEILLCIGNKADLVTGHYAHTEYRRCMQKCGESSSDPHPEYVDYGIDETEACSLLENEEPSLEIRKSCLDWCIEHNIEYIEACASNADFDKCLSVDGDMQGVDRLYGALSAHMWPGMILKSGNKIINPSLVEKEESTDDESEYEIEYEALSHGSDEEWNDYSDAVVTRMHNETADGINQDPKHEMSNIHEAEVETSSSTLAPGIPSVFPNTSALERGIVIHEPSAEINIVENLGGKQEGEISVEQKPGSNFEEQEELGSDVVNINDLDEDAHYGLDDLERLMFEIGNMRDNLRLMPDFQRREMAANLAMKMAAMFGDVSDDENGL
ncbi:unnamed protein product [Musa hybrid cultivar]